MKEDSHKVLGYWCSSHRLDIVMGEPEKTVSYIAVLMNFMRSVVGHVASSSKAQGILRWLAKLIWHEEGDLSLMLSGPGSLASLSYAPQRWLSQLAPLRALVTRMPDLWMYLVMLSKSETVIIQGSDQGTSTSFFVAVGSLHHDPSIESISILTASYRSKRYQ